MGMTRSNASQSCLGGGGRGLGRVVGLDIERGWKGWRSNEGAGKSRKGFVEYQ